MKKIIASILATLLLATAATASAGSAGTASDPLASLSYLNGTYKEKVKADLIAAAVGALEKNFDIASAALGEVYDTAVMRTGGYGSYSLSRGNVGVSLKSGQAVEGLTGMSFTLTKGSGTVTVNQGTVINVSSGEEVGSGSSLKTGQRYFCAEQTRAKFTASASCECLVDGYYRTTSASQTSFKDVSREQWFYDPVMYCVDIGLFKGVSETEFMPGMTMNMAQLLQVLYRVAGNSDAAGEYWYSAAEKWAVNAGIIAQSEFVPGADVTRQQFISMFHRCCDYLGTYDMTPSADITGATDYSSISAENRAAISWAVAVKLIVGTDATRLTVNPDASINRAEVCTMIQRFYTNM